MPNLKVSWNANPAAELVSSYEVFSSFEGAPFVSVGEVAATELTLTSLAAGRYSFKVVAKNLAGNSPDSSLVTSPAVPTAPTGVALAVV